MGDTMSIGMPDKTDKWRVNLSKGMSQSKRTWRFHKNNFTWKCGPRLSGLAVRAEFLYTISIHQLLKGLESYMLRVLREVGSRICAGNIGHDSLIPDPKWPKHISKYHTFYYNIRPIIDLSHNGVWDHHPLYQSLACLNGCFCQEDPYRDSFSKTQPHT